MQDFNRFKPFPNSHANLLDFSGRFELFHLRGFKKVILHGASWSVPVVDRNRIYHGARRSVPINDG